MLFSYPSRVNSRMNVNVCCFQRNLFAASLSSFIPVQLPSRTETYLWYVLPDEVKSTSVLDRYFEILSPCERENVPQEECLASLCTCSYYHCKMMDDQVLLRFTPKNSDLIYYFSDMIGGTLTFFHEERARRCLEVLGTPTREEIRCMNPNYTDFRFPQINVFFFVGELNFGRETSTMRCLLNTLIHLAILVIDFPQENASRGNDLASRLLQYSPSLRCTALEACAHPFFDEFREPNARLPNGHLLPPLFNFKPELTGASPELINRLIPDHVKR